MRRGTRARKALPVGDIFVLAVGAAFYPTLLAIVVVALRRPRPAPLLGAYLAGGMMVSLGIGFVVVFGLDGVGIDPRRTRGEASAVLDIVAGVLSLALAALLATGRDPRPARLRRRREASVPDAKPSWTRRAMEQDSLKVAFGLGVILDLPSVWYLIALKDIVNGGYSAAEQAFLIVGFNVVMFAVIEIPLVAYLLAPESAAVRVASFNNWMRSHARRIGEMVAGAVGAYLLARGITAL